MTLRGCGLSDPPSLFFLSNFGYFRYMQKTISKNFEETRDLGKKLAGELKGGELICLSGDLGSGKTTFSQGVLEALGAEKPYSSPTFMIIKVYDIKISNPKAKIRKVYHIDTYRIDEKDILDLGWEEMLREKDSVIIVEWPERIKNIIPASAKWISLKWLDENRREITDFLSNA